MPFQVIEQGRRIETPWRSLFPSRQVNSLQETARSRSISDLDSDSLSGFSEQLSNDQQASSQRNSPVASYASSNSADRKPIYRADQIMVAPVFTLTSTATLGEALREFRERHIRHIPVVDERRSVVGLISERYVLSMTSSVAVQKDSEYSRLIRRSEPLSVEVGDVMHRRVLTATSDTNLRELTKVMLEHRVGSMPIVAADGVILCMITRSDILQAVSHQVALELWA